MTMLILMIYLFFDLNEFWDYYISIGNHKTEYF